MAFLVVENEKLRRKLRKSQDRRDYYARLYYHLLADMDAIKYELEHARRKIHFLQSLGTYLVTYYSVYSTVAGNT